MASSEKLAENNRGGIILRNSVSNTEKSFRSCVIDAFADTVARYPSHTFLHQKKFSNSTLIDVLIAAGLCGATPLAGGSGGCSPDGGGFLVQTVSGGWLPVFVGENKWQDANPGNAIERAVKNIVFFQHMLISYDYFPYMINLNGGLANGEWNTCLDRISMVGGFMPLNQVHVRNNPALPRMRPFSFFVAETFDPILIGDAIQRIVNESMAYLREIGEVH